RAGCPPAGRRPAPPPSPAAPPPDPGDRGRGRGVTRGARGPGAGDAGPCPPGRRRAAPPRTPSPTPGTMPPRPAPSQADQDAAGAHAERGEGEPVPLTEDVDRRSARDRQQGEDPTVAAQREGRSAWLRHHPPPSVEDGDDA